MNPFCSTNTDTRYIHTYLYLLQQNLCRGRFDRSQVVCRRKEKKGRAKVIAIKSCGWVLFYETQFVIGLVMDWFRLYEFRVHFMTILSNVWFIKIWTIHTLSLWLYYDFFGKSSFHIANFSCQDLWYEVY